MKRLKPVRRPSRPDKETYFETRIEAARTPPWKYRLWRIPWLGGIIVGTGPDLKATALVHEAYVRLVDVEKAQHWNSRGHFFAAAAEAMRRILVEQARRKERVRHGGDMDRVELRDVMDGRVPDAKTILAVDEAVTRLGEQEPVIAQVVQLHFFAGLTLDEIADAIGASRATIYRQWAYARALLRLTLQGKGADTGG